MLSLVVLWRRWAFLGEGIAHAGFGGAGTAWLLAVVVPALDVPVVVSAGVALACLLAAGGIGTLSRKQRVQADTAIGAFLVGALAWGFLGQQVYLSIYGKVPAGFASLLFGQTELLSPAHAQLAVALLVVTAGLLAFFQRDILLYCLDPETAQSSGIKTGRVHYLLIVLIAVAIMVGVRIVESVLITAMLILPGATATMLTRRLTPTLLLACATALVGAGAGMALSYRWPMLPQGPSIVLSLFALFIGTWVLHRK
jgi:ABC-type Mn2+/Zn2+ transport system permease subunit